MEFIPLEKGNKKNTKRPREEAENVEVKTKKNKKLLQKDEGLKNSKQKFQTKVINKKNVKNKYRETLVSKKKNRVPKKKISKKVEEENEDNSAENEEEDDVGNEGNNVEVEKEEDIEEEEEDVEEEEEENESNIENKGDEEIDSQVEAFKKKCKALDEKKKNRLFVKLKTKIHSEAQIKELHPDIRGVIFPRKKKSRWCWAVFASEEKADAAMKKLLQNKNILVNKPNPYEKVTLKLKEKMKTVIRKKEAVKKLQKMWM